jgi:beta-lactamase regulating signal transducer with metallopeptidase domain
MLPLFDSLVALHLDNGGVLFLDVVLKATLLLLLAGGVNILLRGRAAALRHRVWCLAFCGLLILPLLTTFLPSWRLPVLPPPADDAATADASSAGPITEPSARDTASESVAETDLLSDASEWNPDHRFNLERAPMPWETMQPSEAAAALPPPNVIERPAENAIPLRSAFEPERIPDEAAATVHWGTIVCWLWLLGAGLAIWPLLIGFVRNGALHRTARTFDDPAAGAWIQNLCASLGLRRRVRLLETGRAVVPMTWGILRPIVLFPVAWREWTDSRRRLVLLHELAHVKRCDVAFQLMARLACALYWFHPLAWYALRRLRIERELACDDCVLMTGARPSEYAQELLDIARHYQSLALPTTVAMAQTSNLEHRIRALLDHARPHLPLSRTAARFLLLAAIVLVTGVAVVRPSRVEEEPSIVAVECNQESRDPLFVVAPG